MSDHRLDDNERAKIYWEGYEDALQNAMRIAAGLPSKTPENPYVRKSS